VKSRAARGRARLVPALEHLRPGAIPDQDQNKNLPQGTSVQPPREAAHDRGFDAATRRPGYQPRAA
jgi:hypothetical protein